jgi:hypothetical protein
MDIYSFLENHKFNFEAAKAAGFEFGQPSKIRVNSHTPKTSYIGQGYPVGKFTWVVVTDSGDHVIRNKGGNLTFPQ